MTDNNEARLRWLLSTAAKETGCTLSVALVNRLCAAQVRLMDENGMFLDWQSRVDALATEMENQR